MADPQRKLVFQLLEQVRTRKSYSNLALNHALRQPGFTGNPGFVSALFYGVLERQITLDALLAPYLKGKKIDPPVRTILRMGMYQILFLDSVPDAAAVNESVQLCVPARVFSAKGLVNGVLRRFLREGKPFHPEKMPPWQAYSCPEWLYRQWKADYGKNTALELMQAGLDRPPVTVRVNTQKISASALVQAFEEQGVKAAPCRWVKDGLLLSRTGGVEQLPGFEEGWFYVQDSSSQLCASLMEAKPGQRIYDICAAPGGKSCALALEMKDQGEVMSFDLYPQKVELIEKNAARLGLHSVHPAQWDASQWDSHRPLADGVLCDLPCSGYGVLRRKPEIRQHPPEDGTALAKLQRELLAVNSRYVKPGGILIYSTCTLSKQENQDNVNWFLQSHPEFAPLPLPEDLGELGLLEGHMLTIFPHRGDGDGFFIARMVRT